MTDSTKDQNLNPNSEPESSSAVDQPSNEGSPDQNEQRQGSDAGAEGPGAESPTNPEGSQPEAGASAEPPDAAPAQEGDGGQAEGEPSVPPEAQSAGSGEGSPESGEGPTSEADQPEETIEDVSRPEPSVAAETGPAQASRALDPTASAPSAMGDLYSDPYGEEEFDLSREDFQALLSQHQDAIGEVKEGEIVKAKVLRVTDSSVILDFGFKSEGWPSRGGVQGYGGHRAGPDRRSPPGEPGERRRHRRSLQEEGRFPQGLGEDQGGPRG